MRRWPPPVRHSSSFPGGRSRTASGSSGTYAASASSSASSWARWRWRRRRSAGWNTRSRSSRPVGETIPGVEFLHSEVFSGDHGLAVIEHAPFGVIGAVTPVTHSLPTAACNAISMIASGNTVVFNPHPSGKRDRRRRSPPLQRGHLPRHADRQPDVRDHGADAGIRRTHFQASRGQPAVRDRRAGRGSGRHAAGQAGHRGRTGQSARGRRRNGRPGPCRLFDHPRRGLRQ